MASQSETFNHFLPKQQKEPMMTAEIPSRSWQVIAQDLFSLHNKHHLDFWELDYLPDTSSATLIEHTKAHFARYGIPD